MPTAGSDQVRPQRVGRVDYARDYRSPYATGNSPGSSSSRSSLKQEHPSPAFLLKAAKEAEKVRLQTERDVQLQMIRLFESELFHDIVLVCDSTIKKCHNCLLLTRIPNLYKELYDNYRSKDSTASLVCVHIPPVVEPAALILFLRKVYSENDIRKEEVDLIRKIKCWATERHGNTGNQINQCNNNSGSGMSANGHKNDSSGSPQTKDGGGGTFEDVSEIEDAIENEDLPATFAESVQLTDSLIANQTLAGSLTEDSINKQLIDSIANSESITNVSIDKEEESSREASSLMSDESEGDDRDNDSDDEQGKDRKKSSGSSSLMVRSNTFDMLCQATMENALEQIKEPIVKSEEAFQQKKDSMNLEGLKSQPSKNTDDDSSQELDAETPIAEQPQRVPSSPGSLFQFFVDMDHLPATHQDPAMSRSSGGGFMFIDLNNVDERMSTSECLKKNARSTSAIVTKSDTFACRGRSVETRSAPRRVPTKFQTSRSLTGSRSHGQLKSAQVKKVEEEVQLLPMSPIIRRKKSTDRGISVKEQMRLVKSAEFQSGELMSSSWQSEANPRDDQQSVPQSPYSKRGRSPMSNFDDDSETIYSEVSSISSTFLRPKRNGQNGSQQGQNDDLEESLYNRVLHSCSKLGDDLLKMFYEELNTDIVIQVEGREIKAHKCILVARSPYFAAMFTGNWSEKKSNVVSLQGFSFASVHFAICHLYSGAIAIPKENINLGELALISDLLALDTLRQTVLYELKMNYCHFFHKPCNECSVGVIDCLVLSSQCSLTQLQKRCLTWIGKHFTQIWPTKAFGMMPANLLDACYKETLAQLTPDTIIEAILGCERLTTTIPRVKWAEPVFGLVARLLEDTCAFVAYNFDSIVSSNTFAGLGRGRSWNITTLEETFVAAINDISPDVACKTLAQLSNLLLLSESDTGFGYGPYNDAFVTLIRKLYRHCERYVIQNSHASTRCSSWSMLSVELQDHIRDSAVIVYEFEKALAPRPKLSSANKKPSRSRSTSDNNGESDNDGTMSRRPLPPTPQHVISRPRDIPLTKFTPKAFAEPIYDEVPREDGTASHYGKLQDRPTMKLSSRQQLGSHPDHLPSTPAKKSQVAKVYPFSMKNDECSPARGAEASMSKLVVDIDAEIDAASSLVNHCLQEAELLEQELTKKLKKQQLNGNGFRHTRSSQSRAARNSQNNSRTPSNDNAGAQSNSRISSAKASSRTSSANKNGRPPFK